MTQHTIYNTLKTPPKTGRTHNEFSKVSGYKINIQIYVVFLYTSNGLLEREIKKIIPLTITSKGIKCLGINLTMELKDLYSENYIH